MCTYTYTAVEPSPGKPNPAVGAVANKLALVTRPKARRHIGADLRCRKRTEKIYEVGSLPPVGREGEDGCSKRTNNDEEEVTMMPFFQGLFFTWTTRWHPSSCRMHMFQERWPFLGTWYRARGTLGNNTGKFVHRFRTMPLSPPVVAPVSS